MLKLIIRYLILSYVFFISWTASFALGEWLVLPFLFVISAIPLVTVKLLIDGGTSGAPYKSEDCLIILFLMSVIFSHLINQNDSGFNYILAYCFVFCILYLFLKGILFNFVTIHSLYIVNTCGVFFVGFFLSANFFLNAMDVIDLQKLVPRLVEPNATYLGIFNRGYALATEPGVVAFYLNTLGPLALWYLWSNVRLISLVKWLLTGILFFGWLVTFSAAGWFFLIVSLVMTQVIIFLKKGVNYQTLKTISLIFIIVLPILFLVVSSPNVRRYFNPIYLKLSLGEEGQASSSNSRVARWRVGAGLVFDAPFFGKGPRYFSSKGESSMISWYLMILIESGFVSLFLLMAFLALVFIRMVTFLHPSRFSVLVGFFAGSGHLIIISTFFEPFLWLLIAIFYVQQAKIQRSNIADFSNFCMIVDSGSVKKCLDLKC